MSEFDIVFSVVVPPGTPPRFTRPPPGSRWRIVEKEKFGGTCLNRGCIPAKALLHAAEVYRTVGHAAAASASTSPPERQASTGRWSTSASRAWSTSLSRDSRA